MTVSGKNNLSDSQDKKAQISSGGGKAWRAAAMNQEACAIVTHVVDGVRSILVSANKKGEESADVFFAISKAILYHSLLLIQKDPLFERASDLLSDLNELKRGICAHLFESMFGKNASGKEFEYFGCIFFSELDQLDADSFSFDSRCFEKSKSISTFDEARSIVQGHIMPFLGENKPTEELIESTQELLKVTSLKISKALLS